MTEIWRPVAEAEYCDYYEVSNIGRVRSLERTVPVSGRFPRRVRPRILKPSVGSSWCEHVTLSKDGKVQTRTVVRGCSVKQVLCEPPQANHPGSAQPSDVGSLGQGSSSTVDDDRTKPS
jgi:hypothetical protein